MAVLPKPFYRWTTYEGHGGIDYPYPRGTPVLASGGGYIDFSGYYSDRGGFAKFIQYDCGCRHGYYHFDREAGLGRGARVEYGTPFAFVGGLGQLSTGPHLHHEVWSGRSSIIKPPGYWNYIDRTSYVGDGAGASGGSRPFIDYTLGRRQKEDTMYVKGTSDTKSVYAVYTDATGQPANRLCGPAEAAYAAAGGLVIQGDDATLTTLGIECGYEIPLKQTNASRRISDLIWGRQIDRGPEGLISALQDVADTGTKVRQMLGQPAPAANVDEAELAGLLAPQLAPLIADHLDGLDDDDVTRLAKAAADEIDRRDRERLGS